MKRNLLLLLLFLHSTQVFCSEERNKKTEIIDIDRPIVKGISHNYFEYFNVPPEGVILNNKEAQADTIINEITGEKISFLNGNIHVIGKMAHVIIANPNGIECYQCSASDVTGFTLISGYTKNQGSDFFLSNRNYVYINDVRIFSRVAKNINIISNEVYLEGGVYGNVNDLNITSGLVTYNPQLENKVNSYGRISFFDGFGAYLNKINIKHGYGEIYFDKEAYRITERKLNINSLFGNRAVYISYY